MSPTQTKPILYIVVNNHFDLTWRRCWQRSFTYQGQTYISYTDLQMYYMLDNLELAKKHPEYKFEAESVQVVRKFLDRCPQERTRLQHLLDEGRFAITGGGEAIVDSNMITGESLVRNFVDGLLWVEENFGQKTRLAVRNDAFGNSAQLPQILRGCEIAWATGISYSTTDSIYWRGLDGSTILVQTLPVYDRAGGVVKYAPCPACGGIGKIQSALCPACRGHGFDPALLAALPEQRHPDPLSTPAAQLVLMTPEEMLPNPALLDWAEQMRAEYDVRFALEEDVLPHLRPWLDAMDAPPPGALHSSVELNPNNSGCLVTRIKTKQTVRRQEYALQATEALCAMAAMKGAPYPKDALKGIRQQQFFTQFHDAITATHVDAAYAELQEIWQDIDERIASVQAAALSNLSVPGSAQDTFSVINPTGSSITGIAIASISNLPKPFHLVDDQGQLVNIVAMRSSGDTTTQVDFVANQVPPFSARRYHVMPGENLAPVELLPTPAIENARFRVLADENGLLSIFDKALGVEVSAPGDCRPGELILEHDGGSPWATLSSDQQRYPLSAHTRLIRAEKGSACQRLFFAVETPREMGLSGKCLRALVTVSLIEGLPLVDFHVHADWEAFNHRLRVAMPVPGEKTGRYIYEIPYGLLTRQPYEPTFHWAGANGDWPAINWAGVEQAGQSLALFNQGTPSYRIEPAANSQGDTILLSLLRSPVIPTYLHEPEFYTMTGWDGMRDSGEHDFYFAMTAYPTPFADSSVVFDADAYNARLVATPGSMDLPAMPVVESGPARVSAVKWAENGAGLVLRLVEFRGQGGPVKVKLPSGIRSAAKVNLLEREAQELKIQEQLVTLNLRPWEIATIAL